MHGLVTLNKLNVLAAQNAPGAAEAALAEADASREGKPSNLEVAQAHFQAERRAERRAKREAVIADPTAKSCEELISLSRGCGVECTPLEAALANKLEQTIEPQDIWEGSAAEAGGGGGALESGFAKPKRYALPI